MSSVEAFVEVVFVFGRDGRYVAEPYGDGFLLQARRRGPSGGFRHWQLEGGEGEIATNEENEISTVRTRRAVDGPVELPDPALVEDPAGEVRARMAWPAECSTTAQGLNGSTLYELRLSGEAPARWHQLGSAAWVATTADGALARIVVEAPAVETTRVPVAMPADPLTARCYAGSLMAHWKRPARAESTHESLRGNASLTLDADGVAMTLEVHEVEDGLPIRYDAGAGGSGDAALWQAWPCDVTATRWEEDDGTAVGVRFGAAEPDRWSLLDNGVAVGASDDGQLLRLVLRGVGAGGGPPGMFGPAGLRGHDPFAQLTAIAETGTGGLTVYGLAGEDGRIVSHSGLPGALGSVTLGFGENPPFVEVTSTSETDGPQLRSELASELASSKAHESAADGDAIYEELLALEDELVDAALEPVAIHVDGRETELGVIRRGERWGGIARVGETGIYVVGSGRGPDGLELETVHDLGAAVRRLYGLVGFPPPMPAPPPRSDVLAAGATVDGLLSSLQRLAGAPDLAGLFTSDVTQTRGGAERYGRLLGLHAMLRPLRGWSGSSESAERQDDGSVVVSLVVNHATSDGGWTSYGPGSEEPGPDGAAQAIALRLVREGDAWRIDTDLLSLLEERLGTVDQLVRPLSEQR